MAVDMIRQHGDAGHAEHVRVMRKGFFAGNTELQRRLQNQSAPAESRVLNVRLIPRNSVRKL